MATKPSKAKENKPANQVDYFDANFLGIDSIEEFDRLMNEWMNELTQESTITGSNSDDT